MDTIAGWKILYNDGTVITSRESSWHTSKSDGVLIVSIYFKKDYRRYTDNKWVTENYKEEFLSEDYYWMDPEKTISCGSAKDVPEALSDGAVKTGILIQDGSWLELYNSFHEDRIW